jgi:signal transduction histidine kinase
MRACAQPEGSTASPVKPERDSADASSPLDAADAPAVQSRREALGVGPIAGEIAHAMGTPVATLTTSIDLLTSGRMTAEEVGQIQQVMRNELVKLKSMLARCRELGRLQPPALERVDLGDALRALLDAARPDLSQRQITLTTALPGEPAWTLADRGQLGDALGALLANAEDALPEGGAVHIALAHDAADGEQPADARAGTWVLRVEDRGVGIPATAVRNVFRLFFTTRKDRAGVGLSLVQQVAGAHGGSVEVRSVQGRGTRVTLRLPAAT